MSVNSSHPLLHTLLANLSCPSVLGKSLKTVLSHVEKEQLFADLRHARRFYRERISILEAFDSAYRIKSLDSMLLKYDRYYPHFTVERTYNDILGIRIICPDYAQADALRAEYPQEFRHCADMRDGKKCDDGYRGVHLYFQADHFHYPIELQYNTVFDRRLNDWLHCYLYKRDAADIGAALRKLYEQDKIRSEDEFRRELYALYRCEAP